MNYNPVPIAIIGQFEQDGKLVPCAKLLNENKDVIFNPTFVAASLILLYESFLAHVPENKQCEFEHSFKEILPKMFADKEEIIEKYTTKDYEQRDKL